MGQGGTVSISNLPRIIKHKINIRILEIHVCHSRSSKTLFHNEKISMQNSLAMLIYHAATYYSKWSQMNIQALGFKMFSEEHVPVSPKRDYAFGMNSPHPPMLGPWLRHCFFDVTIILQLELVVLVCIIPHTSKNMYKDRRTKPKL